MMAQAHQKSYVHDICIQVDGKYVQAYDSNQLDTLYRIQDDPVDCVEGSEQVVDIQNLDT